MDTDSEAAKAKLRAQKGRDAVLLAGVAGAFGLLAVGAILGRPLVADGMLQGQEFHPCDMLAGVAIIAALVIGTWSAKCAREPVWHALWPRLAPVRRELLRLRPCWSVRRFMWYLLISALCVAGTHRGLLGAAARKYADFGWRVRPNNLYCPDPAVSFYIASFQGGERVITCYAPDFDSGGCLDRILASYVENVALDLGRRTVQWGWPLERIENELSAYRRSAEVLAKLKPGTLEEFQETIKAFDGAFVFTPPTGSGGGVLRMSKHVIAGVYTKSDQSSLIFPSLFKVMNNRLWLANSDLECVMCADPQAQIIEHFTKVTSPPPKPRPISFWVAVFSGSWLLLLAPFFYLHRK